MLEDPKQSTSALRCSTYSSISYLVQNRHRVVSKDGLLDAILVDRVVSESTLTSHINAARKSVADNGGELRLIRTVARTSACAVYIQVIDFHCYEQARHQLPVVLSQRPRLQWLKGIFNDELAAVDEILTLSRKRFRDLKDLVSEKRQERQDLLNRRAEERARADASQNSPHAEPPRSESGQ